MFITRIVIKFSISAMEHAPVPQGQQPTLAVPRLLWVGGSPRTPGKTQAGWAAVTLWNFGWWARPGRWDYYFITLKLFLVNFLEAVLPPGSPVKGHGFLFVLACLQRDWFHSHHSDPAGPARPCPFLRQAATCRQTLPSLFLWCRAHEQN